MSGRDACQKLFDDLGLRAFADSRYASMRRLAVDCYPTGASKLTDTVVRTAAEGAAIAKSLLGVDLAELMGRLATRGNGGEKG